MALLQDRVDLGAWWKRIHADHGIDGMLGKAGVREVRASKLDSTVQPPLRNPFAGDLDGGLFQVHADAPRLTLPRKPQRDAPAATSKVAERSA
jgi:hypothetical protein